MKLLATEAVHGLVNKNRASYSFPSNLPDKATSDLQPWFDALASGACPFLHKLTFRVGHLDGRDMAMGLSQALRLRTTRGDCRGLKVLEVSLLRGLSLFRLWFEMNILVLSGIGRKMLTAALSAV